MHLVSALQDALAPWGVITRIQRPGSNELWIDFDGFELALLVRSRTDQPPVPMAVPMPPMTVEDCYRLIQMQGAEMSNLWAAANTNGKHIANLQAAHQAQLDSVNGQLAVLERGMQAMQDEYGKRFDSILDRLLTIGTTANQAASTEQEIHRQVQRCVERLDEQHARLHAAEDKTNAHQVELAKLVARADVLERGHNHQETAIDQLQQRLDDYDKRLALATEELLKRGKAKKGDAAALRAELEDMRVELAKHVVHFQAGLDANNQEWIHLSARMRDLSAKVDVAATPHLPADVLAQLETMLTTVLDNSATALGEVKDYTKRQRAEMQQYETRMGEYRNHIREEVDALTNLVHTKPGLSLSDQDTIRRYTDQMISFSARLTNLEKLVADFLTGGTHTED